jgi:hypothetical protein
LTIKREAVEERILTALRERLMEPALFAEFCQEFTKEMNRLRMEASASLAGKRTELARIERQLQKLFEALLDDGDSKTIVRNMQALEARQEALEAELSQADSPPPLLHPNMAEVYHRQIRELHAALTSDRSKTEAAEILRMLIDAIVLTPEDGELSVYLKGDLAGILTLAQNKAKPLARVAKGSGSLARQVTLVADLLPMSKGKKRHCWAVTQQQRPFLLERSAVLGPFQNKPALPVSQSDILDRVCARHSAKWQVGTKGWSRAVEQRDGSIRPRRSVLPGMMHRIPSAVPARCTRP